MSMWVVLLSAAAFLVPAAVVFFAGVTLTERLWLPLPALAPAFGTLVLAALSWIVFLAFWAAPWLGFAVAGVALLGSIAVFAHGGLWRRWREAVPVVALIVGVLALYLGFSYLWWTGQDVYTLIASRFFKFQMPVDNTIPMLFAQKIADGQPTTLLLGDWNGGDRPPLQSGFELLFRPIVALGQLVSGHPASAAPPMAVSYALDLLAQLIWIPTGYALLRLLAFRRWVAVGGLVFAVLVPSIMVNTVYTWPKVLSAAMVLCALAFLLAAKRTPARFTPFFALAIVSAVFGVLAHGAAAFAIPALVAVGLYALWGRGVRAALRSIGIGVGIGLVVYAPWIAYQRFVDPPGDRLLKWHLAGVTAIDPRPFLDVVSDEYSQLSFLQVVANRLQNLSTVFGSDQFGRLSAGRFDGTTFVRVEDYTSTVLAISVIGVVLLVMMTVSLAGRIRSLTSSELQRLLIVAGMMLSVLIWALVLFTPNSAIVPHGSHAWLLVFTTIPFCWLLERAPRTGVVLLVVQALLLTGVYFRDIYAEAPRFSPAAFVVTVAGAVIVLVLPLVSAARLERRARSSAATRMPIPSTSDSTAGGRSVD
ncbi:hypothetical protein [Herbiconiux sp. UC225_62]|uniref:hypothetical protein n=1 Tax=Herbiconiux sp. UC225_62 TaxID=3350168 RepID=UPI0036D2A0A2